MSFLTQDTVLSSHAWHTIIYTINNVAIQVFGGLLFAILLSRIKKEELLYRPCTTFR